MADLASILQMLLVPDNAAIEQATRAFNERAKLQPALGCVPELVQVMETCPHVEVGCCGCSR